MEVFSSVLESWKTDLSLKKFDRLLSITMFLLLLFSLLLSLGLGGSLTDFFSINVGSVLLLFILLFTMSRVDSKEYVSFGNIKNAGTGLLLGSIAAVLISGPGLSMVPLSILTTSTVVTLITMGLITPYIEERFFGGLLPRYLRDSVDNKGIVVLLVCTIFMLFHFISYGSAVYNNPNIIDKNAALIPAMLVAFVFRGLSLVGNGYLKTTSFGDSLHYSNNIYAVLKYIKLG